MQKLCKFYEARLNGKIVARGFAEDVASKLGCSKQSIIWCGSHEGMCENKYQIITVGKAVKHYNRKGDYYYSEIQPLGETFIERYFDLDRHGNTIMTNDEYKRHKTLIEDKGYRVKYTKIKHRREKAYYLVEVV